MESALQHQVKNTTHGNALAVAQQSHIVPGQMLEPAARTFQESRFDYDFGRILVSALPVTAGNCPVSLASPRACPFGGTCHPCPVRAQAKLAVSRPGDVYEQEANRIAEAVTRMTEHPVLQRESVRSDDEEENEVVQRKEASGQGPISGLQPEILARIHEVLRSPGQPIDADTRAFFEPRLGHDFSQVRVHASRKAAESATAVNALAYTVGHHIVFGTGQYTPTTTTGKRLLAHEIVHTIQQNEQGQSAGLLQRQPPSSPATTSTTGTGSAAPAPNVCNQQVINNITTDALTWLDDASTQLLDYMLDELLPGTGTTPAAEHQRIAASMQQAFNTTTLDYIEVVYQRLRHVAATLRQTGGVSITCGGPHCIAGGTSITAAYVATPYALVMCNVGTTGNRPIGTFIHELCHAILPQVGTRARITSVGGGVRDRAYTHERVYQHLSPEETLDNASSYALLVDLLHQRVNRQVVTRQADTTSGCTQPAVVLNAFARAEQWNRFASDTLQNYIAYLAGRAPNSLPPADLAPLNASFPAITTVAQLQGLQDAYGSLHSHGFNVASWDFSCARSNSRRCQGVLGYTYTGRVTASRVTLASVKTTSTITLCPDWFNASDDDKIRTIYALFLIGRPSWIVSGFQLRDAFRYVDYARAIVNSRAPAPTTTSAAQHLGYRPLTPSPQPASQPASGSTP